MGSQIDVFDYESVDELENNIDLIYDKVNRLEKELSVLESETQAFLNYSHNSDILKASTQYVEENLIDESLPEIAMENAIKDLENAEEADNWSKLEDAVELTEGLVDRFEQTYESLWNEMGYTGGELKQMIQDRPPISTFLMKWESEPEIFFQDIANNEEFPIRELNEKNNGIVIDDEEDPEFWRNALNQGDPESKYSDARWVNREKARQ